MNYEHTISLYREEEHRNNSKLRVYNVYRLNGGVMIDRRFVYVPVRVALAGYSCVPEEDQIMIEFNITEEQALKAFIKSGYEPHCLLQYSF